jgi:hypothetical protein
MVTLLTPLTPLSSLILRVLFCATRWRPSLMGLRPLTSVYATRWCILTSLPYNGPPQVPERPGRPYLVWESAYSGGTATYIEAFVAAIAPQIVLTWGGCYDFPGTRSVTQLTKYIVRFRCPGTYSWSAYPSASVRMVLSALAVAREQRFLSDAACSTSPAEFAVLYRGFLARRQGDL